MQLVKMSVRNWRGVQAQEVDFDPKITVVGGPNESGKSSLRAALRAALLRPTSARGEKKLLERERPWETKLYPTVELDFLVEQTACSVRKEFLRSKDWAHVKRANKLIAIDDQVQPELVRLLGDSADWIDVLWGEQGKLIYDKAPESIKGKLAAAAQATVLPQVAELERIIQKEYLKYWTPKSKKNNSSILEIRQKEFDAEDALRHAENRLTAANQLSEQLKMANQEIALKKIELKQIEDEWTRGQQRLSAWEVYNAALANIEKLHAATKSAEQWCTLLSNMVNRLRTLIPLSTEWQEQVSAMKEKIGNKPDRKKLDELGNKRSFVELLCAHQYIVEAEAMVVPTTHQMNRASEVYSQLREIEIALKLGAIKASITAESELTLQVSSDGSASRIITLSAEQVDEWEAAGSFDLQIPGVARLFVTQAGESEVTQKLEQRELLKTELDAFLEEWSAQTLDTLQRRVQEKSERLRHLRKVDATQLQLARIKVQDAQELDASTLQDLELLADVLPGLIAQAEDEWKATDAEYQQHFLAYEQIIASNPAVECNTLWSSLESHLLNSPIEGESVPVVPKTPSEEFLKNLTELLTMWDSRINSHRREAEKMQQLLERPEGEEVSKDKLDLLSAQANNLRSKVEQLSAMLNQSIGQIHEHRNLYEEVVRAREDLAKISDEVAKVNKQAFAIDELNTAFVEARARLQRDVVAPLQELVARRFSVITAGFYNSVSFDATLALNTVHTDNITEGVSYEDISFGTQEQLALLTRLCLAELLADSGERQVVILDDNLVHTDAARMALACRLMEDVADKVQIVVFTCHPERYSEFSAKQVFLRLQR